MYTIFADLNNTDTHSFGNNLLKEKRERATGAENELNRAHK